MADIERINELVAEKDFENAKVLLDKALQESPDNVELLKLAGLTAVNLKNWPDAKKYFETVVKYQQDDATSWFYLASSYESLGDSISSKNAYINVINLRPEYMEAYQSLCVILLKLNEIEETVKYAKEASKYAPEEYLYDFIVGTAYMKAKEAESALPFFESAYAKASNNVGVLNSLGTCYMAVGEFEKSIETYKKVLEINPQNSMAYFNIGSAYQIIHKHEEACVALKQAVEIEEDETFISALAMSEVKLKRYADALEHYKQLVLLCPGKENYKYNLATCYEAVGNVQTAINILENLIYVNPKFIMPAQKLASLYIKTNQLVKAKEIYDKVLLKNKLTADVLHQYAILTSSLCDTDTAEKMLKKVIKMNPEMAVAHKDLGIIYMNKRLFDYAEEEFKLAMDLMPDDFEIIFEYGNFLYSTSKNTEAEIYYGKALELKPKNVLALTFMALNYLVLNKLDDAKKYIMQAINEESNHEYVQFCVGRILYARGEYEEAKSYLIRAVEQNPDIETQNILALTYFALEDYNQALNIFKNIDSKRPNSISVLMYIAKCYEKLNENDNALEYLDKVVNIFPENEDAHEMIRRLS